MSIIGTVCTKIIDLIFFFPVRAGPLVLPPPHFHGTSRLRKIDYCLKQLITKVLMNTVALTSLPGPATGEQYPGKRVKSFCGIRIARAKTPEIVISGL
jgi:hypothetical protein